MDLKRITVDEVLAAYETLGVDKIRECYWTWRESDGHKSFCACPASVVAICRQPDPQATMLAIDRNVIFASDVAKEVFDRDYLNSFICGVDNFGAIPDPVGYQDGLAVRAALWPEPANA